MKVIDLRDRTIFVDDIIQLYSEDYSPRRYNLETKNGIYRIDKEDYFNVRCYLLSLNNEVETIEEDKKIENLKSYISCGWNGTCKDLKREDLFNDLEKIGSKINEIIDYLDKEDK